VPVLEYGKSHSHGENATMPNTDTKPVIFASVMPYRRMSINIAHNMGDTCSRREYSHSHTPRRGGG
jgi:hypothetical protein